MNVYDRAHELARAIRETPAYKAYTMHKQVVENHPRLKERIDAFHALQLKLQQQQWSTQSTDAEDEKRLHDLLDELTQDERTAAYLEAEMRYAQIMSDIGRILSEL